MNPQSLNQAREEANLAEQEKAMRESVGKLGTRISELNDMLNNHEALKIDYEAQKLLSEEIKRDIVQLSGMKETLKSEIGQLNNSKESMQKEVSVLDDKKSELDSINTTIELHHKNQKIMEKDTADFINKHEGIRKQIKLQTDKSKEQLVSVNENIKNILANME